MRKEPQPRKGTGFMNLLHIVILFFLGSIILQVMYGLLMNVLERGNF